MFEKWYSRQDAAQFLRNTYAMRTTPAGLATMASRGGGPIMHKEGRYAKYRESDLIDWARLRCSGPLNSTSSPKGSMAPAHLFERVYDAGDLPDPLNIFDTGDPKFDEITRLLDEQDNSQFAQMNS